MNFIEYVAVGAIGLVAVYMVARLISAAYFQSKHQHEQQRKLP